MVEPTRVSFPRGVWIALAIVALLQVGGILTQVVLVNDQLDTNKDQRGLVAAQLREARALADPARPLAREQLEDLPKTRRLAARLRRLAAESTPLAAELRAAGVDDSVRTGRALAAALLDADIGGATRAGRELTDQLLTNDTGTVVRGAGYVMGELLYRYRLRRLLARSLRATAVIPKQYRTQVETLRAQRRALKLQERTVQLATELLAVARDTERHAESLDRKFLGSPAP